MWVSINAYKTIRCHILEDNIVHSHQCENFKSNTAYEGKEQKMLRLLPFRASVLCTIQCSEKSQLHEHTFFTLKFTAVVSCDILTMQNIQTSWFITIYKWHYLCTYNFILIQKNRHTDMTRYKWFSFHNKISSFVEWWIISFKLLQIINTNAT
jgi:hypothetical protein